MERRCAIVWWSGIGQLRAENRSIDRPIDRPTSPQQHDEIESEKYDLPIYLNGLQ